MTEIEKIKKRYEKRKDYSKPYSNIYWKYIEQERELKYFEILHHYFDNFDKQTIMEIGAGNGTNLLALKRLGFQWTNMYANELLDDRVNMLKKNLPNSNIYPGDALQLEFKEYFDIVFQSTVFTSILDDTFKQKLASKMFDMVKKDGMVLWYDFKYDNPSNKDVKGVGKKEIIKLFPDAKKIVFHSVTLAPPIGRRVGKLYNFFNLFPFLRTHIIAEIYK